MLAACGSDKKAGASSDPANVAKVNEAACRVCHAVSVDPVTGRNILAGYLGSPHNRDDAGCQGCHGGGAQHNGIGPIPFPNPVNRCSACHDGTNVLGNNVVTFNNDPDVSSEHLLTFLPSASGTGNCGVCHNGHDPINAPFVGGSCIACHAFPLDETDKNPAYVNDNSGVRAIVAEFNKRSHHITGGTPTNAQCAVCHLEGKPDGAGGITINTRFHMVDNKIHLRDVDHGDAEFAWDGTNHAVMDNFCFSCHDSDGASDLATLRTLIPSATASNPFNDTLTNGYDQVTRAAVVDVRTAFTTTNASHHAVSGQRYKYRFSTRKNADMWAVANGHAAGFVPNSEIAEFHVGEASPNGGTIQAFDATDLYADKLATEEGGDATLFEGGKFVSTYTPLGATQSVADNSTLHCGDCHTVGQWKPGSSTNADGSTTSVAIGAHGSANEYLLRNSLGTDAIHNSLTYVCFNCHQTSLSAATPALWAQKVAEGLIADSVAPASGSPLNPTGKYIPAPVPTWKAGWNALHPVVFAGQVSGYATAHAVSAMHIQCVADSADNVGATDRLAKSWYAAGVKTLDYLPAAGATAAVPSTSTDSLSGNITGIGCTNCHNSGLRSGFGGIHGGNGTYTDGLGRPQTTYRFMPGMGNYRYAPPGGWDGHDKSDPTLLTANNPLYPGTPGNRNDQGIGFPGATGKPMGGCYTNGGATGSGVDSNDGYSSCSHHGTSTTPVQGTFAATKTTSTGATANFRANYGGGTTGSPTAFEPTVREATAGGTLVTRPLKY
jgi:hypothetical protein